MNDCELIFYPNASLLEGPRWNRNRNELLCVSIEQGVVYLLSLNSGKIDSILMEEQIGCAVYEDDNHILIAGYKGIYRASLSDKEVKFVTHIIQDNTIRYNDGILDPIGRFIVGTTGYKCLAPNRNGLYSIYKDETKLLIPGTTISNGIGFSLDRKRMYFVDSPTKKVMCYDYNVERGDIENGAPIIYIFDDGIPDGICVDIDDMLWVAHWGGSKVSKWNPYTGEKIDEVILPCKNVSSCCVGGENNEYLFVTTAKHDDGTRSEEQAGGLFRVKIKQCHLDKHFLDKNRISHSTE